LACPGLAGAGGAGRAEAAVDPAPRAAGLAAPRDTVAGGAGPTPAAAADSTLRAAGAPHRFEYLWVVRTALLDSAAAERVVRDAREMGVRGLLVQVVGRGDALHRSDLLPRAEALGRSAFDPLALVVARGHEAGLEVHAWMNCLLVWSAPGRPRDPRHVLNAHPEWVARLADGRRMTALGRRERQRLGVEGVYLSPGHPGVRAFLGGVAREIAQRYAVDGVHLDYVREPVVRIGFDPTTRARFALAAGVDPARFGRVPAPRRAAVDSAWTAFRAACLTDLVREVRDSIATARPGVRLSAAVVADTVAAERTNAQAWRAWLRAGLIERAFVMCYAPEVQTVMDQLAGFAAEFGPGGRVVPGIAVYNTTPAHAAAKVKGARALGFAALAVYSYDALEAQSGYWPRLRDDLDAGANPAGHP
jgi:uncharacterized lipoprotein YddW (UPF0748 family)